jgi:hypothetical protein
LFLSLISSRNEGLADRDFGTIINLELNDQRPIDSHFLGGVYMEDTVNNIQRFGSGFGSGYYSGCIS